MSDQGWSSYYTLSDGKDSTTLSRRSSLGSLVLNISILAVKQYVNMLFNLYN